jgi:hypothetical protein
MNLVKNYMSSDIRCLQNVGTYLNNRVASHPDDSNLQYLNYFVHTKIVMSFNM